MTTQRRPYAGRWEDGESQEAHGRSHCENCPLSVFHSMSHEVMFKKSQKLWNIKRFPQDYV